MSDYWSCFGNTFCVRESSYRQSFYVKITSEGIRLSGHGYNVNRELLIPFDEFDPDELGEICANWFAGDNQDDRINQQSSCFIATVIYQDVNASEVCLLRQFRDQILTKHLSGRVFIILYYAWLGKTLAKIVSLFGEPGRLICKVFMGPLIWWISRSARRTISQINRR